MSIREDVEALVAAIKTEDDAKAEEIALRLGISVLETMYHIGESMKRIEAHLAAPASPPSAGAGQ